MTDMKFTDEQLSAIDARGCGLILSAAAGSGKTTVLTSRIIKRVCEENADISRITALTFTRAAALQLRDKITAALNERIAADPGNAHLRRQKLLLGRAKIMTTDSYCLSLVRDRHSIIGYPSDFRIVDEEENKTIETDVMRELLTECFENDGVLPDGGLSDFKTLYNSFGSYRQTDGVIDRLSELYEKYLIKADFIKSLKSDGGDGPAGSPWIDVLYGTVGNFAEYYKKIFEDAISHCDENLILNENYRETFEHLLKFIDLLLSAVETRREYNEFRKLFGGFAPLVPGKKSKNLGEYDDDAEFYKACRLDFIKNLKAVGDRYFSYDDDELSESFEKLKALKNDLYALLAEFDRRLLEEKKLRRVMSFSDVERCAFSILYNEDGTLSETAEAVRNGVDEVYIDEYQDTNELQEAIFSAIAEERKIFRVGDVKQSVYEFRGAVPEIMTDKLALCEKYRGSGEENGVTAKIFLSHNFRSEKPVIDFVNNVFGELMKHSSTVRYTEDEMLRCTAERTADGAGCEMVLLDADDGIPEERYVARRIKDMVAGETINGEKIRYSDIAIILMVSQNVSDRYIKALSEEGIPCRNVSSGDLFQSPAVLLTLCLLNVIDDPENDIYLTGLMCSPLYGISFDQAVCIRKLYKSGSLYSALVRFVDDTGFDEGKRLIGDIEKFRRRARATPCDELIWYLYGACGLFNYAGTDGERLNVLYEYARKFEQGSFKGLDNFVKYIREVIDGGKPIRAAKAESGIKDAVSIMTIHHSKGLEYPVCFFCDTAHGINRSGIDEDIAPTCGFTAKLSDENGIFRDQTFYNSVAAAEKKLRINEEALRKLYVAMTRAKSRLIITGKMNDPHGAVRDAVRMGGYINGFSVRSADNMLKWLLESSAGWLSGKSLEADSGISLTIAPTMPADSAEDIAEKSVIAESTDYSRLFGRMSFEYPREALSSLPLKLAVSDLYPTVLDRGDGGEEEPKDRTKSFYKPGFIRESEGYVLTSAERGTALHVFMQFCSFEEIEKNGVAYEIDRLLKLGFLDAAQARSIPVRKVERFFEGSLYQRMKNAVETYREKRFIVSMPAADFTGNEEKRRDFGDETIIVQGVIDCAFVENDGRFCLVDYKTDSFPRTMPNEEIRSVLKDRHSRQLGYYDRALEIMYGRKPDETLIYSFALSDTVPIE